MRKKLSHEISISEMLTMRQEGLTNKQIAERLDISVSTVYQYIGRRSEAVKHAAVQRKPCPIPAPALPFEVTTAVKENVPMMKEEAPKAPVLPTSMPLLKESHTYDLQGVACVFHLDTGSHVVEMKDASDSTITGMIDADNLPAFIRELQEVLAIFKREE